MLYFHIFILYIGLAACTAQPHRLPNSRDAKAICIIRTVYIFAIAKRQEAVMHAAVLPLHAEPLLEDDLWPTPFDAEAHADVSTDHEESEKRSGGSS
jgi:hypothetical protein